LIKLAILNAGGAFGRVLPNFLADRFGTYNMLLLSLFTSSMLVFVILAIHTPNGMTCFALLYGFWSGSCMFDLVSSRLKLLKSDHLDVSLIPSLLVQLTLEPRELGYVYITSSKWHYRIDILISSIRMGVAFSIVAVSLLGGTPIEGVLLRMHGEYFEWASPTIFCGVRRMYFESMQ